jgi:Protein of unknown function (DUF3501)
MESNTRHGPLTVDDLMSLEQYAKQRAGFRANIMAHKKVRSVALGPNATVLFEDRLLVQYQIQEMLRAERIFEQEGIEDELNAYNPMIPDTHNLKATLLIEFVDPAERQVALMRLRGFERHVALKIGEHSVPAIADEDLERENDTKTSAVHFLRFHLSASARAAALSGADMEITVSHPQYQYAVKLSEATRASLVSDL